MGKTKKNKSFWEKFREISLYIFAVVTLLFGSGLVWMFCGNDNNSDPTKTNEQTKEVLPQVEIEQPQEKQKGNDTEMTRINDTKIESRTDLIKGEGIIEDFTEAEAREQAFKKAQTDLFSKFPKEKEQIVDSYAKVIMDTTGRTSNGMWKAHIIISVNESQIK